MTDNRGRRYDTSTIVEVKRYAEAGWSQREIRRVMLREHGFAPSFETISKWLNEDYAEKARARVRRSELKVRAQRWSFRLPGRGGVQTKEYQDAFIRRLDQENLASTSIAKVCNVVFGERCTTYRVLKVLGREA